MSDSQDIKNEILPEAAKKVISNDVQRIISRFMKVTGATSESELARLFGKHASTVRNHRLRGSVPYELIHIGSLALGYSIDWVLTGRGQSPTEGAPEIGELPAPYPCIDADDDEYLRVPLYDIEIAAGDGTFWDGENVEKYLKYRREDIRAAGYNENALVAFRSRGDSMTGTINDRDIILADRSQTEPDGVFVIRVGDRLRVKRLQRLTSGSLRVSSDNTMYAPETIDGADLEQVEIIGQCCERCGRIY